jgi:YesN/AraC family two-component response regulator
LSTFENAPTIVNILIADDERTTRVILRMLLKEHHFNVVGEASDGEEAVKMCSALRPDIVFLDIDMPKLNGHDATVRIREENSASGIVIISALATAHNVKQALEAGANSFIVKPFTAIRVVDAIEQCRNAMEQCRKVTTN